MKAIKLIYDLNNHSNELINKGNLVEANNNITLLIKIFSMSFAESQDPLHSILLINIFKSMMNTIRNMRDHGYNIEFNSIFLKLFEIVYKGTNFEKIQKEANKSFIAINTFSYYLLGELMNVVEDTCDNSSYYKIKNMKFIDLLDSILSNIDDYSSVEFKEYFYTLYAKYYELLTENKKIEKYYIDKLIDELVHNLFDNIYILQISGSDRINHFIKILLPIAEKSIDNNDYHNFSKLMIQFNNKIEEDFNRYDNKFRIYCSLFINVIVVYLFFLFKQNIDKTKFLKCKNKKEFSKEYVDIIDIFQGHIKYLWQTKDYVKKILEKIEYKFVEPWQIFSPKMEYVLIEFYFFSTIILQKRYNNLNILLTDEERFIINGFFTNDEFNINEKTTKDYINQFYQFTGFERLNEQEFVHRANEFIKLINKND